jgi:hypothetical protein
LTSFVPSPRKVRTVKKNRMNNKPFSRQKEMPIKLSEIGDDLVDFACKD